MRALMLMEEGQIIPQQGAVPIKRGMSCLVPLVSAGPGVRRMKRSHVLESAPFNTDGYG